MEGRNALARRTRVHPTTPTRVSLRLVFRVKDGLAFSSQDGRRPAPTQIHRLENQLVAEEVNAPTGSDSGSLTEDTNGAGPKAITTNIDLSEEVVNVASTALERYNIEKDVAAQIRTEFYKRHGLTGTSSSTGTFAPALLMTKQRICSYNGSLAILIRKS
ncbi:hypothetical protein C8Q76DRAFT_787512 [Earliella scabrosa]|nr:hypothetical protein C8Q76DRAFT_787512 [Earliella scabrosa]